MSAAGKPVESVGDLGFELDNGGWLSIRPDGKAQTVAMTHHVFTDDLDGPGFTETEHQILLTTDDLDCLIATLMDAGRACLDGLPARPPHTCFDCGRDVGDHGLNEDYMIHNALWEGATCMDNGVFELCIECLEKRLGRALTPADFTDASVNGPDTHASALLHSRRDGSATTGEATP